MDGQEEDFSSLSIIDRLQHKVITKKSDNLYKLILLYT